MFYNHLVGQGFEGSVGFFSVAGNSSIAAKCCNEPLFQSLFLVFLYMGINQMAAGLLLLFQCVAKNSRVEQWFGSIVVMLRDFFFEFVQPFTSFIAPFVIWAEMEIMLPIFNGLRVGEGFLRKNCTIKERYQVVWVFLQNLAQQLYGGVIIVLVSSVLGPFKISRSQIDSDR